MMSLAEKRVPIKLGGRDFTMIFNANTMCAFEDATGKFFLRTTATLLMTAFPNGTDKPMVLNPGIILGKVSMVDLRALLWASIHEYDADDNPTWPLKLNQVGRMLRLEDILPIFNSFLTGQSDNNPTEKELGESQAEAQKVSQDSPLKSTPEAGGERGIELPADAFA